jgi:small subunit ribosomal protein S16
MAMKIRLARGGSKKRPHYSIVAADSRMARDGRFIEKLGTYDPLLPKDNENRIRMDLDRVQHWLGQGAQPTDRVSRFLEAAGVTPKKQRANLKKGAPGKAALERAKERADKAAAAEAAAAEAPAAVPASAEVAEEAPEAVAAADVPDDTPVEMPVETPSEAPAEAPAETPAEVPADAPAEVPDATPVETPADDPADPKPAG